MHADLTNLLPAERQQALERMYYLRLATVSVLMLAGVVLIYTALMAPSYIYLEQQVKERAVERDALDARLRGQEEQQVSARVRSLKIQSAYLGQLRDQPAGTTALRSVLSVPHAGVRLTGLTFTQGKDGGMPRMTIAGIAGSREALRAYDDALADLPFVTSADLPISAYAKERDIDFLIVLTGPFMP